jgi:hypothetical protein
VIEMEIVAVLASSLLALGGVWLGGALSVRAQERTWHRERAQRRQDLLREAYGSFLAAARRYRAYLMDPIAEVTVVPHPADGEPLPLLGEQARPYKDAYESAWSNVLLLAENHVTVDKGSEFRHALHVLGGARAAHGAGAIPEAFVQAVRDAEQGFRTSAQGDLGMLSAVARDSR